MASSREVIGFGNELPVDGRLIDTSEGRVFVIESGNAGDPQVLFGHGTAAWSGLWWPVLNAVADAGFRAVAFDMPPFGWSEYPDDSDYSRSRQAERVIAILESLGTPSIVVAHSMSAGPIAEAVLRRPDLVSAFVIVDGAISLGDHETASELPLPLRHVGFRETLTAATVSNPYLTKIFLQQFIYVDEAATSKRVALLQEPMRRQGYTSAVNDWLPQLFVPPTDALSTRKEAWRGLQVPLTLIWGREDDVTPPGQAEEIAALVENAQLIFLEGVGHIPQIEAEEEFQKALIPVLQSYSKQPAGEIN